MMWTIIQHLSQHSPGSGFFGGGGNWGGDVNARENAKLQLFEFLVNFARLADLYFMTSVVA